jgi:hypothetical protein
MNQFQKLTSALVRITGGNAVHASNNGCGGNVNRALARTTPDAITPYNRPGYAYNAAVPHLRYARTFTPTEAAALKHVEDIETANWEATQKAYNSYENIQELGTKRHQHFQEVARRDSDREMQRVKANETTETALNKQAVDYHKLRQSHLQNIQGCNAAVAQVLQLERNVAANF